MKLRPIKNIEELTVGYMFYCPGCRTHHAPYVYPYKSPNNSIWMFNNNFDKPTFSPSILTRVKLSTGKEMVCHSYVTDGKIRFLSDCTHHLANQTVDLPDID